MIKKILLRSSLLLCCLVFIAGGLQAQRVCDLRFTQLRYQQMQPIPQGDTVWGALCIKNLGPDTIYAGEPIYIRKSVAAVTNTYTGGLLPGDSIRLKLFSLVNEGSQDSLFSYCFWKGSGTTPYTDPNSNNDTVCVTVHLLAGSTGIRNTEKQQPFAVYPNPLQGNAPLQLQCPAIYNGGDIQWALYNVTGSCVYEGKAPVQQSTATLLTTGNQSSLPGGIYALRVQHKGANVYTCTLVLHK